ncbi:fumarylacetoacetate hydrolase family protein [Lignipirellula cremea]|uniref:Ureidoglycolate lyase n=1 Tax=Lignipirellula cremea TaxID=2528010 RepID=A0A518DMJ4_9BACT|nr:fumarylacetoacetate hydrolase family protein [Lignipirellula cremea]QDU93064.1 Ureidoglycolate lyase [Lignipirellula cremea]
MRLCRFSQQGLPQVGFYGDEFVVPLDAASAAAAAAGQSFSLPGEAELLPLLPGGSLHAVAQGLFDWLGKQDSTLVESLQLKLEEVELLLPQPRPNKLFLLAGNYAAHIEEGGAVASERADTFPYVFMKPPSTTLINPGEAIRIPQVSPAHVDWELELAVVIGRGGKGISEAEALKHVAGYTVINDISDRKFRPNPERKPRDKDGFFDWLHGKWHDSFCPCGPCITSAEAIADPQNLEMKLLVNGKIHQDASTGQQIFPVAAVIAFISSFVTLEAGDIISTGTPAGVGNTTGVYLQPGDQVEAYIGSIGSLRNAVVAE